MTTLTLRARELAENERANLAREAETYRHNKAMEDLASSQFSEGIRQFNADYLNKSAQTDISRNVASNNFALGLMSAKTAAGNLAEQIRHNLISEQQKSQELATEATRVSNLYEVDSVKNDINAEKNQVDWYKAANDAWYQGRNAQANDRRNEIEDSRTVTGMLSSLIGLGVQLYTHRRN